MTDPPWLPACRAAFDAYIVKQDPPVVLGGVKLLMWNTYQAAWLAAKGIADEPR